MSTTTEDIKARLSIVEVVGQYVRLQKAGTHWKANCPFHQEKTPSFNVNEERQMWHCFGCGKGGDAFAFVMEIEGIEFREALKLLAERAGIELPAYRSDGKQEGETKDRGIEILELATKFYEKQLWESAPGKKILDYLHERGLSDESIKTFRLGYAPEGWEHLSKFLVGRGYRSEELERAGLSLKGREGRGYYDRFRDRIMFPIGDVLGRIIGYSARVAPGGDETQAKYVNTPETNLYHKSKALYGLYQAKQAIKESGCTVLVEGNMDVIALHQAGISNTVAVSGTALTTEQLTILKRYGKKVALFFDMDKAGQAAAWKSTIAALTADFVVTAIGLAHGKDAADMNREDPELLRTSVAGAIPAMQYFLRVLVSEEGNDPEGRHRIVERYTELLSAVTNDLDRAHWTKELAGAIQADPKVVQGTVEKNFRTQERGDRFVESRPTIGFLPKTFGRRSEVLRESLIGLMLASPEARMKIMSYPEPLVRDFLSLHPLFFFIQNNPTDPVAAIEDRTLQSLASNLVFRTLSLPQLSQETAEANAEGAQKTAEEYLASLLAELREREKLGTLDQAMIDAARHADPASRQKFFEEFSTLARPDASQNE